MRKKLSRISAAIVVILTALLGMFPQHASAIGIEDKYIMVASGKNYDYSLDSERPYIRFDVYADGEVTIKSQIERVHYSGDEYAYYLTVVFDADMQTVARYYGVCENTMHTQNLSVTDSLKKGTYYLYQGPVTNKSFCSNNWCKETNEGWKAKSRVNIKYPTPTPSPKITKISTGNRKAWVYWNPMSGATSYRVYVIQNGKERLAGSTTKTKFLVTDMNNGVKANYYVKAVVNGKLTNIKNIAYSTPRNGVKPKVVPSAGKASITWTKYNGATQYKVVAVDQNNKILAERVTKGTAFTWNGLTKGRDYGFYIVPYVGNDYIPFGRSYAEDRANITHFTAK